MCEQREQLLDYLYDEATPASRRDVERHLETCDECRDEIKAFRNVREDLLAWGVPNPPSVWTAFTAAPVVPWHRQVPAWALAAAAGLMIAIGGASGFMAQRMADGGGAAPAVSSNAANVLPVTVPPPGLDAAAIMTLIKDELAKSALHRPPAAGPDLTGQVVTVNNTAARPFQLDARTEERLLGRVVELVNTRDEQQRVAIRDYLVRLAQEDDLMRRDEARRTTLLQAQVEQLQAQVSQLVLAQSKGQ